MQMTFRWYNSADDIKLEYIKQIPYVKGIVTAVYDIPVGEVWDKQSIYKIKKPIEDSGLKFEVIESIPVHEEIKLGSNLRDKYIENYCTTIRNLGKAGIKCICYNFMPVFDWLRSNLEHKLPDGSTCLSFDNKKMLSLSPNANELSLPGWNESYKKSDLLTLLERYKEIDKQKLWDNLTYFLNKIIPVCEDVGIKMAIHPDDPPWEIFGLPRIITDQTALERLCSIYDSPANGIALCFGSLGCNPKNNLPEIAKVFARKNRINFVHARNVHISGERSFEESAHLSSCGSLDMYEILKTLYQNGFDGYIRPDHGRNIFGENGRPGYGLYDRALGAAYVSGIWEALEKGALK